MKQNYIFKTLVFLALIIRCFHVTGTDYLAAFKDTLTNIAIRSNNDFMTMHCNSIIKIINSRTPMTAWEGELLKQMYDSVNSMVDTCSARNLSTYIKRRRPFIVSWVSPTDGYTSDALLKPPKNWDPDKSYPLYLRLHGQTGDAQSSIKYMTYPFISKASVDSTFDDGYLLSPWGRGNSMYIKMAETDIWECLDEVVKYIKVDSSRIYLVGLSMGGYGAWHFGTKWPNAWAAIGIYAGVLAYDPKEYNYETAEKIKDVPTYIICGTRDQLYYSNEAGYNWLVEAGNPNLEFITFDGDHEFYNKYIVEMHHWIRNFTNDDWNFSVIENNIETKQKSIFYSFPNPVKSESNFCIELEQAGTIKIEIYNNLGQLVDLLTENNLVPGQNQVSWKPVGLKAGIYFCTLRLAETTETIKVIVQ